MNRLLEIGFEHAGFWSVNDCEVLDFNLTMYSTRSNILYAFICDGEVKYVGKTNQKLSKRMQGYKNPTKTQSADRPIQTNKRNHIRIIDAIKEGLAVDIFALPDDGLMHYGKFHLNLAAGLEDDIIRQLAPEWNGGLNKTEVIEAQSKEASVQLVVEPEPADVDLVIANFELVLQPTYFNRGFFNVSVKNSQNFGADGENIEIFLGEDENPILGTINRSANTNQTPRIMGGSALKSWFQGHTSEMGKVLIRVYSPNSIQISPISD